MSGLNEVIDRLLEIVGKYEDKLAKLPGAVHAEIKMEPDSTVWFDRDARKIMVSRPKKEAVPICSVHVNLRIWAAQHIPKLLEAAIEHEADVIADAEETITSLEQHLAGLDDE
jgi:hypothetical protein